MKIKMRVFTIVNIALLFGCIFYHRQGIAAGGIDHLIPADSTVFCEVWELDEAIRIRKALHLDDAFVEGGREALLEIVTGRTGVEPVDSLLSLNRKRDDSTKRSHFVLEWREATLDSITVPKSWKVEIARELAETIHEIWTKVINHAHNAEPTKTSYYGAGQWFRCYTEKGGSRTAVMPAFIASDGRLQAMAFSVVYAAKWVKSEGKDQEMKKRFREELEKIASREMGTNRKVVKKSGNTGAR